VDGSDRMLSHLVNLSCVEASNPNRTEASCSECPSAVGWEGAVVADEQAEPEDTAVTGCNPSSSAAPSRLHTDVEAGSLWVDDH